MRTTYWLTGAGQEALYKWLAEENPSASTRSIRTEFLSRLYISRLLHMPASAIIDAQKKSCVQSMRVLKEEREALEKGVGYLAVDLRLREMQIILAWLDDTKMLFERLESMLSI